MIPEAYQGEREEFRHDAIDGNILVDSTLDIVVHSLRSNRCSFMLLDTEAAELRVGKARGLNADTVSNAHPKLGESIAGLVAIRRQPLLIHDIKDHPELRLRAIGGCRTDSLMSVPILVGDEVFGVLNITDRIDDQPFDEHDLETLNLLARHLALCIENSLLQAQIQHLANTDGLTGVYNHRYFQERLQEEIERASRFGKFVSLMMLDVNEFKEFNDTYGHQAGDILLQEIAAIIKQRVRHFDLVSRYGGDEFTVTLPETDGNRAMEVAERIVRAIAAHRSPMHPQGLRGLTVSIGVSTYPSPAAHKHELIEQADKAMYAAKQEGRYRVRHWDDALPTQTHAFQVIK